MDIYRKLNPEYATQEFEVSFVEPDQVKECETVNREDIFIIGHNESSQLITPEEEIDDEDYDIADNKSTFEPGNENEQFEDYCLEFEEEETEEDDQKEEEEKSDIKPRTSRQGTVLNRKSYTVEEKLKIIEHAEQHNNRVTARHYEINESSVRCFRRQKEMLLKMNPLKKTNRKAFPHWPKLEEELKEYVINHPLEHGTKAKLKEIKQEALCIASRHGIENFNGSNSYIFKFMTRHKLPSASPRPRKLKIVQRKSK